MDKLITASSTPKKIHNRTHRHHPNTQTMVDEAFKVLNKKKCSYRAIKNFIVATYLVDIRYLLNRIKGYIRESLSNGKLIQMTGHGLNGSFKMSAAAKKNPNKFLKKSTRPNKLEKINVPKITRPKKPITFQIDRISHRRTSLTRFSTKTKELRALGRSPRPFLANQRSITDFVSEDENDSLPSTSAEAMNVVRVTRQENSHMF